MSYKEIFLLVYGMNKGYMDEKRAKEAALDEIITIYKDLHEGKTPMEDMGYGND